MQSLSRYVLVALAAAALFSPAAQAQSKKELVAKVIALQKPQYEQFGNMLAQVPIQQLVASASQVLNTRIAQDKREALGKSMEAELQQYGKDVVPALRASALKHAPELIGAKLEANFNEEELKQLIGYLESPVIKRYAQMSPEFQNVLAQRVTSENRALIEAKARALDAKLASLLGVKPAPAPASGSK